MADCSLNYFQKTSKLCVTPCADPDDRGFLLSGDVAEVAQELEDSFCKLDSLLIPGGSDGTNSLDRYCGNRLSPESEGDTSTTVCSEFRI